MPDAAPPPGPGALLKLRPETLLLVSAGTMSLSAAIMAIAAVVLVGRTSEVETCVCPPPSALAAASFGASTPLAGAAPPSAPEVPLSSEPPPGSDAAFPSVAGQSVGMPRAGALYGGRQLEPGEGYIVRDPVRAWGTDTTIRHIQAAVAQVRERFPRIHRLVVGDLSTQTGGRLLGHFSHQSGRDVDLGFYYRQRPVDYPQRFVQANADNLHFRATFALLEALAETAGEPDGVEWILVDYRLQKMLHRWAKRQGYDDAVLDRLFQYPHGATAERGLLRHFPEHSDHMHVRFKCPLTDPHCASPPGPPSLRPEDLPLSEDPRVEASLRTGEDVPQ